MATARVLSSACPEWRSEWCGGASQAGLPCDAASSWSRARRPQRPDTTADRRGSLRRWRAPFRLAIPEITVTPACEGVHPVRLHRTGDVTQQSASRSCGRARVQLRQCEGAEGACTFLFFVLAICLCTARLAHEVGSCHAGEPSTGMVCPEPSWRVGGAD